MIKEIHNKFDRFIMDYGGAPDTLFLSSANMIALHNEFHVVNGQLPEGSIYMGMTVVLSEQLKLNVGIVV